VEIACLYLSRAERDAAQMKEAGQRACLKRVKKFCCDDYFPDLAGAGMGLGSSSTECAWLERVNRIVSERDVIMKMTADHAVSLVSTLAAARGPKAVCEPWPPNAPARSAERPCCRRTTPMRNMLTMTWTKMTTEKRICIS